MAEGESRRIVHEDLSEPHVRDRRISVRQIHGLVDERGEHPDAVADRFDLDVVDVYHALAYYHDHPAEMREVASERSRALDELREELDRPAEVDPDAQ